ncbi:hypothetical protein IKG64_01660 [Candidatus Saccharibacteria bacterium]|nr:hypothetical protein [Candidatus Saccharibacteria bacterium]
MGKKIPLLISTLMATLGSLNLCQPAVFADEASVDKNYWTVAELLAAKPIIDDTKTRFCGDGWECREGISMAYRGLGNRAGGAVELESLRFAVTSINPSQGTFRAIYFGEDIEYETWTAKHYNLTELEMFWVDESLLNTLQQPTYYSSYVANARNGVETPGLHVVLAENETNQPSGWFPEAQEISYLANDDISNVPMGELHFYMDSERGNMSGAARYSSCIESPDYQEGMECRLVYSSDIKWFTYIPMDPADIDYIDYEAPDLAAIPRMITVSSDSIQITSSGTSDDTAVTNADDASETNTNNSTDGATTTTPSDDVDTSRDQTSDNVADASTVSDAGSSSTITQSAAEDDQNSNSDTTYSLAKSVSVKAPETGKMGNQESAEFFWWSGPILLSGVAAAVWLFWPESHKKSKKVSKNS